MNLNKIVIKEIKKILRQFDDVRMYIVMVDVQ